MSPLIPPQELLSLLLVFSPCFTRPAFVYFVQFIVTMVVGVGRLTTTTVFRSSDGARHYTNYARFLSRYRWSVGDVAQRLLDLWVARPALWLDDLPRTQAALRPGALPSADSSRRREPRSAQRRRLLSHTATRHCARRRRRHRAQALGTDALAQGRHSHLFARSPTSHPPGQPAQPDFLRSRPARSTQQKANAAHPGRRSARQKC